MGKRYGLYRYFLIVWHVVLWLLLFWFVSDFKTAPEPKSEYIIGIFVIMLIFTFPSGLFHFVLSTAFYFLGINISGRSVSTFDVIFVWVEMYIFGIFQWHYCVPRFKKWCHNRVGEK